MSRHSGNAFNPFPGAGEQACHSSVSRGCSQDQPLLSLPPAGGSLSRPLRLPEGGGDRQKHSSRAGHRLPRGDSGTGFRGRTNTCARSARPPRLRNLEFPPVVSIGAASRAQPPDPDTEASPGGRDLTVRGFPWRQRPLPPASKNERRSIRQVAVLVSCLLLFCAVVLLYGGVIDK